MNILNLKLCELFRIKSKEEVNQEHSQCPRKKELKILTLYIVGKVFKNHLWGFKMIRLLNYLKIFRHKIK